MRTMRGSILFCIMLLAWAAGCSSISGEEMFLKVGNKCYVTGDSDGAIVNFTRAIEINPNCAEAYKNRGFALNDKGAFYGAIADWTKAIRLNPALGEHISPHLAEAYKRCGYERSRKSDYDGAVDDYTKAIDINPGFAEAYADRGIARYNKKDFSGAIVDLKVAGDLNPALEGTVKPWLAKAYNKRGNDRYIKSDCDGAISDYTSAIKTDPKNAEAYFLRACVYARLGRRLDAYSDMGGAIKYGRGYEEKFKKDELLSGLWNTWQKAVNLGEKKESGQKDAKSCYGEGLKYYDKGKYKEAITWLDKAEALGHKEKDLYFKRGDAYNMTKAFDKAVEDFTRYISLAPDDPKGYFYRGTGYLYTWMPEESIRDYRKAISLNDKRPEYRFGLAAAHACAMNRDLMFKNLRTAISKVKVYAERARRIDFFQPYYDDEEFKKLTK